MRKRGSKGVRRERVPSMPNAEVSSVDGERHIRLTTDDLLVDEIASHLVGVGLDRLKLEELVARRVRVGRSRSEADRQEKRGKAYGSASVQRRHGSLSREHSRVRG